MISELNSVRITPNEEKTDLIISGHSTEITIAKTKFHDVIKNAERVQIGVRSQYFIQYLKLPEIKQYLQHQLELKNVFGAWDMTEDNIINIYSLTEEQAISAAALLLETVKEFTFTLPNEAMVFKPSRLFNEIGREIKVKFKYAIVRIRSSDALVVLYISLVDEAILRDEIVNLLRINIGHEHHPLVFYAPSGQAVVSVRKNIKEMEVGALVICTNRILDLSIGLARCILKTGNNTVFCRCNLKSLLLLIVVF